MPKPHRAARPLASRIGRLGLAALLTGGLLACAACASANGSPAGSTAATRVPAAARSTTPSISHPSTSRPRPVIGVPSSLIGSARPTGGSPAGSGGSGPVCSASQLRVSRRAQHDGGTGPGDYTATFLFANSRSTPCTLTGFPRVTAITSNGTVVAGPAAPAAGAHVVTVTLAPTEDAQFTMHEDVVEGARCPGRVKHAGGLEVVAPGQPVPLVIQNRSTFCALIDVTPVAPAR
jgi:hypothetical protein